MRTIENGKMQQYTNKNKIRKSFGEPVYLGSFQVDGKTMEEWMYRYAIKYFDSPKVYLYFDEKGALDRWGMVSSRELASLKTLAP